MSCQSADTRRLTKNLKHVQKGSIFWWVVYEWASHKKIAATQSADYGSVEAQILESFPYIHAVVYTDVDVIDPTLCNRSGCAANSVARAPFNSSSELMMTFVVSMVFTRISVSSGIVVPQCTYRKSRSAVPNANSYCLYLRRTSRDVSTAGNSALLQHELVQQFPVETAL
ncbi:MAG: hypothetical protein J07HQX50_02727 [Haloquadratum sp. J07HQX50]|nr:MAG: hypothetical protein J07HQX50_02727 [Haloquadratum sp. J07HQX50]